MPGWLLSQPSVAAEAATPVFSGAFGRQRMANQSDYKFVTYGWDDAAAARLDPVGRLVYRSNLLGADQRVTNTGGGNTSAKLAEVDPLTGESVQVLWVKGSGGDLRTSKRENFASLYLDRVLALESRYAAAATRGAKTPVEDEMVGLYPHATFGLNPRASSIDTPLHAFLPAKHVDHTHPNAAISVAASENAERLTREIYGDDVVHVGWQRPGFDLGIGDARGGPLKRTPKPAGVDHGSARADQLGGGRPGLLRAHTAR